MMRAFEWSVTGLLVLCVGAAVFGYREARSDPIVRRATIALPGLPVGARPVTVALLSDIHIGSAAMDVGRLTRIVAQVNARAPDVVLLAGDFVEGHDAAEGMRFAAELTRPLAALHAPLGVMAVLGNHDHDGAPDAVVEALGGAGITVLANAAMKRGPLVVVGIDDAASGHAKVARALDAGGKLPGAMLVVTHAPDAVAAMPPSVAPLVLAGHTHCGQVMIPFVERPVTGKALFDPHYRCGIIRDPTRMIVITAGLGTSVLPLRIGAPPDWWLLTLVASRSRP